VNLAKVNQAIFCSTN